MRTLEQRHGQSITSHCRNVTHAGDNLAHSLVSCVVSFSVASASIVVAMASSSRPRRQAAPTVFQLAEHLIQEEREEEMDESSDEEDQVEHATEESSNEEDSESDDDGDDAEEALSRQGRLRGKSGFLWNRDPPSQRGRFRRENVLRTAGGPTSITRVDSIRETFQLFVQDELLNKVIDYTNRHANQFIEDSDEDSWYARRWRDLDIEEFKAFIGCLIYIGIHKSGNESYEELWSEDDGRPKLRATMSLNRFKVILKFLRFDDKNTREDRRQRDKLSAFREIWEMFLSRCRMCYSLGPNGTIDEMLVGFRGRCPFRVYMPSKPNRYGIKIWVLADSDTCYFYNAQIYLGKEGNLPEVGQASRVVMDLCRPIYQSGRNITTDNFFTSVPLANNLLEKRLTLMGTLRSNKPEIPPSFQGTFQREVHSSTFGFTEKLTLCSYVPKKRKAVILLSSLHHDAIISDGEERKPKLILDYNSKKGAVDTIDMTTNTYSCNRQTRKYPTKLFTNMLNVACWNSFVVWMTNNPDWNRRNLAKRRLFLKDLAEALMKPHIWRRSVEVKLHSSVRIAMDLCGVKSPQANDEVPAARGDRPERGRCHMCEKRNQVRGFCVMCHKFVCNDHSNKGSICVSHDLPE